jgi:hypothetical protein
VLFATRYSYLETVFSRLKRRSCREKFIRL